VGFPLSGKLSAPWKQGSSPVLLTGVSQTSRKLPDQKVGTEQVFPE